MRGKIPKIGNFTQKWANLLIQFSSDYSAKFLALLFFISLISLASLSLSQPTSQTSNSGDLLQILASIQDTQGISKVQAKIHKENRYFIQPKTNYEVI
jgi:hypothetical protein